MSHVSHFGSCPVRRNPSKRQHHRRSQKQVRVYADYDEAYGDRGYGSGLPYGGGCGYRPIVGAPYGWSCPQPFYGFEGYGYGGYDNQIRACGYGGRCGSGRDHHDDNHCSGCGCNQHVNVTNNPPPAVNADAVATMPA